jgi:hypothetical protein
VRLTQDELNMIVVIFGSMTVDTRDALRNSFRPTSILSDKDVTDIYDNLVGYSDRRAYITTKIEAY